MLLRLDFCHYSYTVKSGVLVLSFYSLVYLTREEMTPLAFSSNRFFHHPSFPEFWRIINIWMCEWWWDTMFGLLIGKRISWNKHCQSARNFKEHHSTGTGNKPENFSVANYFYSLCTKIFLNKSIRCVEPVFHLNEETVSLSWIFACLSGLFFFCV